MRRRRVNTWFGLLAAGQGDSLLSSLASLMIQIYAVRTFGVEELATFSLAFTSLIIAGQLPTYAVFNPHEILGVRMPVGERTALLRQSVRQGLLFSVPCGLLVVPGTAALGIPDLSFFLPLVVTGATTAVISPVQDHIRRVAHLAERSGIATVMSGIHLLATSAGLVVLGGASAVAPFGALLLGNVVSVLLGLGLLHPLNAPHLALSWSDLLSAGRWLVGGGAVENLSAYASSVLIGAIGGQAVLGAFAGAQVVARPVQVAGMGLAAVISPRSMGAARRGDMSAIRRYRRIFNGCIVLGVLVYGPIEVVPWTRELFAEFLPNAFLITGLPTATVISSAIGILVFLPQAELLGAGMHRSLAMASVPAGVARIVGSLSVSVVGAFAGPISTAVGPGVAFVSYRRMLGRYYAERPSSSGS